ncbi:MAG: hypothetical protein L6Q76_08520 [Polyangiaceae bacterium]|nr:hypothetical protein [Polyangiaceae bacterium]
MNRSYYALFAIIPALIGGYVACAGEDDVDVEMTAEAESEARNMPLVGTFRAEIYGGGGVTLLALKTDGTFHREIGLVCVKEPCDPEMANGKYIVARRKGRSYLDLMNADGALLTRYEYLLKGDLLRLRAVSRESKDWETLQRSRKTWCGVPNDCSLQNIPKGNCTQPWSCDEAVCKDLCTQ